VTYVPYDTSFETPDEGGINGPPDRDSIRARVKPSRVQLAFLSQRSLLEVQLRPQRCDLCRAQRARPASGSCQLIGRATLKASVSSRATTWSWSSLRCALNARLRYSIAAQHLLPNCCQVIGSHSSQHRKLYDSSFVVVGLFA
jgi:hypothetical protein